MLILVSNDDGLDAPGLTALAAVLADLGRVVTVAPDRERSAVGHALTLHRPLRLTPNGPDRYAVDGTPTDCVHLAVHGVLDRAPDLLVSGINQGGNLADDLTYSGTVGVALEGTLFGIPSLAVSLVAENDFRFAPAAKLARRVAGTVLAQGLPRGTFLNLNVPSTPAGEAPKGVRITRQGRREFGSAVVRKTDPRGRDYYWIGARELGRVEGGLDTDVGAVEAGWASVTPIHTDLTHGAFREALESWNL